MFKHLLLLTGFWLPTSILASNTLNVMTSYQQPVVAAFQEAFEEAHPDTQLNILWRQPDDALKVLLESHAENIDIVWMPSARTFTELANHQLLQPLDIDLSGLPQTIGTMPISDPQRQYLAFEIAGYGLFVDAEGIAAENLPMPNRWDDLTQAVWREKIILPIPSKFGFAPMMFDQLLQAKGWSEGWNTWQKIAANSQLDDNSGAFITDQIRSGPALVGLIMDFFAFTSIQHQQRYRFIYPEQTAFNPAHIAVTSTTQSPEQAKQFVTYMLSEQGQAVLLHPDVRRLPVRASLYQSHQLTATPFSSQQSNAYDHELGKARRQYVTMLFDAAITDSHSLLVQAWQSLHLMKTDPAFNDHADKLQLLQDILESWPVAEPDTTSAIIKSCAESLAENSVCQQERQRLSSQFARHYQQVIDQLERLRVSQ